MTFIQFYDADLSGKIAPVCGDRGVVILDGRTRLSTMIEDAKNFNGYRRPVYDAFAICRGESFGCFQFLTPIIRFKEVNNGIK